MKVEIGGRRWSVSAPNDEMYALHEIWERDEYRLPEGFQLRGGCILDIGANVGGFAVYADQWPNRGPIYSWEPNPVVFRHLLWNTRHLYNYRPTCAALHNRTGAGRLQLRDGNTGSGRLVRCGGIPVVVEDALSELQRLNVTDIDVLKIDTEGSEIPILTSLWPTIHRVRYVVLEWHSEPDRRKIESMFCGIGRQVTVNQRRQQIGTMEVTLC